MELFPARRQVVSIIGYVPKSIGLIQYPAKIGNYQKTVGRISKNKYQSTIAS